MVGCHIVSYGLGLNFISGAIRAALLNEIDLMLGLTDSEQRIRNWALEGIVALVKDGEIANHLIFSRGQRSIRRFPRRNFNPDDMQDRGYDR
jgi:hypothetical protein